jgi:CHAT domain-containing protein/Tfp pilus assembly protein PilF
MSIDGTFENQGPRIYRVRTGANQYFRISIRPNGTPLSVQLIGPSGSAMTTATNPAGQQRTLDISHVAAEAGGYSIRVSLAETDAPIRNYTITLVDMRPARTEDATRVQAEQAREAAKTLQAQGTKEALRQALVQFDAGIALWHGLDNMQEEGRSLDAKGDVYLSLGEKAKAADCLERALALANAADDDDGRGSVTSNLGVVAAYSGNSAKALEYYQQSLDFSRRANDKDLQAITQSNIGSVYMNKGNPRKALEYVSLAAELGRQAGDRKVYLTALANLAAVNLLLGETRQALGYLQQALPLRRQMQDRRGEAQTLQYMAHAFAQLGEPDKAVETYRELLPLAVASGDKRGQVMALANVGTAEMALSEPREALGALQQALPLSRELGDAHLEETALTDLARVYVYLGDAERALDYNSQALKIQRRIGDKRGEAVALDNLGASYIYTGETDKALECYRQALPLARGASDRGLEANLLNSICSVFRDRGEAPAALPNCEQAVALSRDLGDRQREAVSLVGVGSVYLALGSREKAVQALRAGKDQLSAIGDKLQESKALFWLAKLAANGGDWQGALQQVDAALEIDEALRTEMIGSELRSAYFSTVLGQYELRIDVLMHLDRLHANQSYDVQAFETSERARARSLLDLLSQAAGSIRQGVDTELVRKERILRAHLRAKAEQQIKFRAEKDAAKVAGAEADLRSLTTQYRELEERVLAKSPRYAAFIDPQPLTLDQLRRGYLDENTLLLEYSLGKERSFVWAVTGRTFRSFELPGRAAIERLARRAYAELSGNGAFGRDSALAELSRAVLGPIAPLLGSRQLLVVADGALQYVPFSALPSPRDPETPLIVGNEVVSLPSASTIAFIRGGMEKGRRANGTLAVLADPVFSADDPRLASSKSRDAGEAVGAPEAKPAEFDRLPSTRREAEAILSLAGERNRFSALDFDASLATATSGVLSRYRFIHLASHGVLNSAHPELSGIVLSLVDRAGRPQSGILQTTDIFNLDLHAELVVMSACQTALGAEVRGEGLVGLTRAFLYAGSPRVAASLWTVPDLSTAELMARFYRFMLVDGLRPAAALRRAQVSIWNEGRWARPYYWAAFTLQGEWR